MNQFYMQLVGVLLGGLIATSGAVLAHFFASSRDTKNRKIDGLQIVGKELSQLARLMLDVAQLVNGGMRERTPEEFNRDAFQIVGWKEMTLQLQSRTWRFPCMAYLPEALPNFEELSQIIFETMDSQGVHSIIDGEPPEQAKLAIRHHIVIATIEEQIRIALKKLL